MSQGRRNHSESFKARVTLEAVKEEETVMAPRQKRMWPSAPKKAYRLVMVLGKK